MLGDGRPGRAGLQRAFERIESLERPLLESTLERLLRHPRVVRVSLPHYNTPRDVERLLAGLDALP